MFYCSLNKNSYLMLHDKKIKGSAKNYKIKRKKDQTRYNISGIKYHKRLYLKMNLFTNVFL